MWVNPVHSSPVDHYGSQIESMGMYRATIALMVFLMSLTASARAAQLDDAVAAAHKGEYAVAFQLISPLAEKGDARAQFNIGYMYANGWGVRRDFTEAVKWYRKAAEQGLEIAQHYLGIAYINGEGIVPDDAEAARWFKRAAEQGFSRAQLMLGRMYLDGKGVPKDLVQGYAWVVLAGQRGTPSRIAEFLMLTPEQHVQAQEVMARWKPKPESSLSSVADPRPEEILGLDPHLGGELADTGAWPASAIGVVAIAFGNPIRCSGALVGSKIVLTAAHCLFAGKQAGSPLVAPGAVHFLVGMSKGTPAATTVAEQLIVSKDFVPGNWTPERSAADWALIVLKDPIASRPLPVKALTNEELKAASIEGTIYQIGYGMERRYSPSVLRNCLADLSEDNRTLMVRCLANFGYSGSPILAEINGSPTVIGVFSAFQTETRKAFACSASQFEEKLKELTGAAIGQGR
jgi:V8-like Glu-specific endopeptidase